MGEKEGKRERGGGKKDKGNERQRREVNREGERRGKTELWEI